MQYSLAPGPDEQIKCFNGYLDGAEEVPCRFVGVGAAGRWVHTGVPVRILLPVLLHKVWMPRRLVRHEAVSGPCSSRGPALLARSEAAVRETPWEKTASLPLEKCPDKCNMRG